MNWLTKLYEAFMSQFDPDNMVPGYELTVSHSSSGAIILVRTINPDAPSVTVDIAIVCNENLRRRHVQRGICNIIDTIELMSGVVVVYAKNTRDEDNFQTIIVNVVLPPKTIV